MIDVDKEISSSLAGLEENVCYYYPGSFSELPVISYYGLTEKPAFTADNSEMIQSGSAQVDIWSDYPAECGELALKVHKKLSADGWAREFSMNLPPDAENTNSRVYHRTMRYTKIFNV